MKLRVTFTVLLAAIHCALAAPFSTNGNRLAYLDSDDPFYPGRDFPKLTTPQWVGEEGVEAVVVLAIDDMRDTAKYEAYLRPILERLKQIDGRAPVSIMTCNVDPANPQLQTWLKEGLSIECHTVDHPRPLLQGGDFAKAKSTYERCIDLMNQIPGNKPVAFRMPCCDSMNTPSPRFWAEIFNKTTEQGHYLQIEVAGLIEASPEKALAQKFLAFMMGPGFQDHIATSNWMFPAGATSEPLPAAFDALVKPEKTLIYTPLDVDQNRRAWIDEWLNALAK